MHLEWDSNSSTPVKEHGQGRQYHWHHYQPGNATQACQPTESPRMDAAAEGYDRGDLAEVPRAFERAMDIWSATPHQNPLYLLFLGLAELGIDLDVIQQELVRPYLYRCSRCSKWYRDDENGPKACIVSHIQPCIVPDPYDPRDGPGMCHTRYYTCCGTIVRTHSSRAIDGDGVCYVGPHTPFEEPDAQGQPDAQAHLHPYALARPPAEPAMDVPPAPAPHPTFWPAGDVGATSPHPHQPTPAMVNPAASVSSEPVCASPVFPAPTRAGTHLDAAPWRPGLHMPSSDQTRSASPRPSPKIYTTLPWKESSLYHPPGWIEVPASLREQSFM
ncbi:hypothetical protein BD311DRAFT_813028 [Dichomitus squalens]|uniref:C2H2-type domain-containing protein n=1 Tax=Dichomitus squalens TaxID=114155 RepID=A0A4Q9N4K5_9APHY|nr:hypothetical protein BD311DRAFT_813028 [Dichomitus squalens]